MKPYKDILFLAVPIALHSVLFASLGFIDTFMLSALGGDNVAAAGIGSRVLWFVSNVIVGIAGATTIFCAQHWGAKDNKSLSVTVHIGMIHAVIASMLLVSAALVFKDQIAGLMTNDGAIAAMASSYIEISILCVLVTSFSAIWGAGLRAIQKPKVILYLFVFELVLNVSLNYLLIFGHFGFPALGLEGAAWGTLVARTASTLILFFYVHAFERILSFTASSFVAAREKTKNVAFVNIALPIIGGEIIWSGGMTAYHTIYGNIDGTALAAMSILAPLEILLGSFSWGCAAAVGVLVGQKIGSNNHEELNDYVRAGLIASVAVGGTIVALLWIGRDLLIGLFNGIEPEVLDAVYLLFPFILASIFLRSVTMTSMSGILKSGGDTKFTMYLDMVAQWFGAIPLMLVLTFWFELPVQYVYAAVLLEETLKLIPVMLRIRNRKWIKTLSQNITAVEPATN
ncbi:MATE family efflux transporter [Grimontia kaedaensis]|uniref:Multidrug resistance protein NorM n=1 Tax=Grimontia kaedaensis TaxID=2872157 RepID=A0ABY4WY52_9GAMM|nr:MATE family efflux transporter [Grimontia kaedaensis]USH03933.1 MATE family efflux transporter [Grimontia kaedaensis]